MRSNRLLPLLVLLLTACGSGATTPSATDAAAELPADQVMFGLRHVMSSEGIRRALLVGDTAYFHQAGDRIDLVGVRVSFFDENGRQSGELTARTGSYERRVGTMVAEGDVVLRTEGDEGERVLETEKLHFDVHGDRLWSDQPVVLREGGRTVHGTSFTSDGRFQNVRVQNARASENRPGGGGVRF